MLDLLSRMFQSVVTPMLWLSLTAAFVAVIVMILRRILRSRIPHQVLCVLWLIVFARLLLPVSVETPFSLVPSNITNQIYQTEQEPEQPVEPEAESQPSAVIPDRPEPVEPTPAPVVTAPVSQPQIPAVSDPIPSMPVTSSPVVSQPENPVVSDPVVPEPQTSIPPVIEEEPSIPETPVLSEKEIRVRNGQAIAASVWLLGVAAMLVSGIVSYAKLRRQVYDAIRAEDGVWEHPSLRSPFILGLFRPNIYLPMGIAGPARQFILHHERAHLRRWDHVVKPICWLALAIHWFNPFAWGAFLLMSRDIEAACDESVIRKLGSEVKADYSATLLALATDKRFPAPSPLSFGEGDAEERIKNVLKFKKPVLWVSIGAVVVAAIAAVCLLTNQSPRSLDSFYPQVNWEKVESARAGYDLTDMGNYGWQVELSDQAAAEAIDLLHEYKYWKGLSHLEYDNRIGWMHSVWRLRFEFENGSHITLKYTKEGILVVIYSGALLPEGSALKSSNIHYSVDGGEELASEMLALIQQEEKEAYTENLRAAMKDADIYSEEFPLLLAQLMPSDVEFSPDDPLTADDCAAIFAQAEWLSGEDWRLDRSRGAAYEHIHYIRFLLSCFLVGCEEIDWNDYTGQRHMTLPNDIVEVLLEQVNQRELLQSFAVENITHYSDTELAELMDKAGVSYENAEAYDITVLFSYSDSEPVKCTYCILFHDDSFKIVSASCESEDSVDDPIEDPAPISALGELFLSALNDKAEIIDPGLGMTATLSELVAATVPTVEMNITEIAAVDLDDDGIEEILLNLQTAPDAPYGTMILHYSAADGKVYGHSLWARAFMDVKEDGTFSYSGGAATNGVARLSFTPEGCEKQVLLHQDFDLDLNGATDDYYYYRNGEAVTEQEFYSAFESWQSRPNLIWTEYTPENAEAIIRQHFDVTDAGQASGQDFLSGLPTELVTYNTLPADPEEYYLVAELPEQHIWLYAQNWGQDSMLRWDNSWWPLEGRVAHSHHMTLPQMFLLEETPGKTTAAVISQIGTGTGVELYELAAYVMGGHTAEAGNSFGMQNYVYDCRSAAEHFNQNNTLLYDAETDALTLFWNGTAYFSGTLGQDLSQHFGLEDGFTGALVVNGDIIRFEHIEGSRFAVTAVPCIAKGGQGYFAEEGWWRWVNEDNYCFPMSVGVTGFTLTWTVEFNGSGFDQVGEVSIAAPATAKPGTPDYANEIMAAIGGFVEKRQAIPQDYLLYLTEEQRAMAEDYNRQTKTIRGGAASAVIDVVSVIKGEEISYYDLEDTEYQIIGQLADALLFPDYGTRIRENGELNAYLSQWPDSIIRLDSAMAQHFASWAGYQGITVGGYCELADRLYRSLDQGGPVPTTDAAMAASMLILERQAVSEDVLSKLDGDSVELIKKYNEQTAELKDVYYKKADSLRYALFYEENRTTQQWFREAFAQRLSAFALYKNYSQLAWTDPLTSQVASYEAGGSYGLWATYFRHEGERLELPQSLLDYLSLVESLLIRLNQAD